LQNFFFLFLQSLITHTHGPKGGSSPANRFLPFIASALKTWSSVNCFSSLEKLVDVSINDVLLSL
jgi:hypothetical protein